LARVFIVYDTKYGNTKLVAEKIAEGMRELKGVKSKTFFTPCKAERNKYSIG